MAAWEYHRDADGEFDEVAKTAVLLVTGGCPDDVVVIPQLLVADGRLAGISQATDGITAAAAIDVLRWLVADYEDDEANLASLMGVEKETK